MRPARMGLGLLGLSIATLMSAAGARAQSPVSSRPILTDRVDPTEFGIQEETITAVTGTSFMAVTDSILDFGLFERNRIGHAAGLMGFALPAHDWDTDYAGPPNVRIPNNRDHQYVLLVEQAPSPHRRFFGGVEVWWHRTVSAAPDVATFSDVPPSDPFFQSIEALAAAGISAGCGDGKFCSDAPLTRGQMAVFLSKALGLPFPD